MHPAGGQVDAGANSDQQQGAADESHPELVLRLTGMLNLPLCPLWYVAVFILP